MIMVMMKISGVAILLIICMVRTGGAIWLTLPPSGTKCVSEEIQNNVVVLGDYAVVSEEQPLTPTISVKVTSPYGNNLHKRENTTHGQFAFTTHEAGNYLTCFWVDGYNHGGGDVSVNLDWKTGVAAKDWESVARKEKIEKRIIIALNKLDHPPYLDHAEWIYSLQKYPKMHTGKIVQLPLLQIQSSNTILLTLKGIELELRKLEGSVEAIHENLLYLKSREADMRNVSEKTNSRVAWYSMMSLAVCIAVSTLQIWHLKRFFQKKKLI